MTVINEDIAVAPTSTNGNGVGGGLRFKSILSDQEKYHVKHPLNTHWCLFQKVSDVQAEDNGKVTKEEYEKSLQKNVTLGTIEDFWWYTNFFMMTWHF